MATLEQLVSVIARAPGQRLKRSGLTLPGMSPKSIGGLLSSAVMKDLLRRSVSRDGTTWIEYIPQIENNALTNAWNILSGGSRLPDQKPVGRIVRGVMSQRGEDDDEPPESPLGHVAGRSRSVAGAA